MLDPSRRAVFVALVVGMLACAAVALADRGAVSRTYIVLDSGKKLERPGAIHTTDQHRGRSTWVGLRWTGWGSGRAVGRGRGTLCNVDGCQTIANVTVFAAGRCKARPPLPYYAYDKITATYAVGGVVHSELGTGYAHVCRASSLRRREKRTIAARDRPLVDWYEAGTPA